MGPAGFAAAQLETLIRPIHETHRNSHFLRASDMVVEEPQPSTLRHVIQQPSRSPNPYDLTDGSGRRMHVGLPDSTNLAAMG